MRRLLTLFVIAGGIAAATPGSALEVFTLHPRTVVSGTADWSNTQSALGPPVGLPQCFDSGELAYDPGADGDFLEVGDWDPFTLPEGHRITKVILNSWVMGSPAHAARVIMRARGSIESIEASPQLISANSECNRGFPSAGWDLVSHKEEWTVEDVQSLVVGARVVASTSGSNGFVESFDLKVTTDLAPDCGVHPDNTIEFGLRLVGSTNSSTFRIFNFGGGQVEGTLVDSDPFFVASGAGPYSLGQGQFREVTIHYMPTSPGEYVYELVPGCGPVLTGQAIEPATDVGETALGATRITAATPSPFRDRTGIDFVMGHEGRAGLAIHDVRGSVVRVLRTGFLAAGVHRAVWDGRDAEHRAVPAGVYFVRLSTDAGISKRTILRVP